MLPLCIRLLLTVIVVYSSPNEMHTCSIYIFRQARQQREKETEGKTQKSSFPLADVPGSQQFQLVKKKRISFLFCIYFRLDYFHLGTRIFTVLSQNEDVEG